MALLRGHDDFYGGLQFRRVLPGFTLAHRVADCPPEAVDTQHLEAHFVLVTSGQYISSAQGTNEGLLPLVYNPPGTTHRDHFRNGVGSFFTVSVSADRLEQTSMSQLSVGPASFLMNRRSRSFAKALLSESAQDARGCGLHLESLSLELLDSVRKVGQNSVLDCRQEKGRHPDWLDRAYELLQDSYARCVTVRELACAAGVHPVHLARAFRRCFGCTPGQFASTAATGKGR